MYSYGTFSKPVLQSAGKRNFKRWTKEMMTMIFQWFFSLIHLSWGGVSLGLSYKHSLEAWLRAGAVLLQNESCRNYSCQHLSETSDSKTAA